MKRGFTLLLFSILFYCTSFGQQRPVVDFYADVITAGPNDTICIPVKVKNFNNILGIGLGMRWLPGRLTFLEVRTNFALNDISSNDFGLTDVENGNLKLSWITSNFPSGISLDDDATIFEVCFVQSGNLAEDRFSYLSFDDEFLVPEIILDENIEDFPLAYANFTPGGVFIPSGSIDLQMSPEIDFGLDCGTVNVSLNPNVFGGMAPYQYDWSGPGLSGAVNTPTLEGELEEGTYVVEVKDQNDNIISGVIEVDFMGNEEGLLNPTLVPRIAAPNCGQADGSIDLNPVGDDDDFLYLWEPASVGATSEVENLPAGDYAVIVIAKESSCSVSETFELRPVGELDLTTFTDTIGCGDSEVLIGIADTSGLSNFSFNWTDGVVGPTRLVNEASDYGLIVSDGFCTQTYEFIVPFIDDAPMLDDFQVIANDIDCATGLGQISINYTGDLNDLIYLWSTGETTPQIIVTNAGTYSVTIANSSDCQLILNNAIEETPPNFDFTEVNEFLGCATGQTRIGLSPNDGRNYVYTWSTNESTATIDISSPALYGLTVSEEGTACVDTYEFDFTNRDPSQGMVNLDYTCNIENDCYSGADINIQVEGFTAPINYTFSDGNTVNGGLEIDYFTMSREPLELYLEDTNGCRDTIRDIVADCAFEGLSSELRLRQYVVCEENPETQEIEATFYNEVLGNLAVPPYAFFWGNGFQDTSYFRSSQPLEGLPNLFISVTDRLGNNFSRQISESVEAYACGDDTTPVFSAEHQIVAPGSTFKYPIYLSNHQGLARAIYTIDWNSCLLQADSIIFYAANGETVVDRNIFPGTYETFFELEGGSPSNDSTLVAEVFFNASTDMEGISAFLFSINEVPIDGAGNDILMRAEHGSITVAQSDNVVTPGDADQNGIVNNKDVLNIGLGFNQSGPDRRAQQIERDEFAYPWLTTTPFSGIDYRNVDSNGDGIINEQDVAAIEQNFNSTIQPGRVIAQDGEVPLFLAADTIISGMTQTFPIMMGEELLPAVNVYGVAFSLSFDPAVIDPTSIEVNFANSWLGAGENPLSFSKVDQDNSLIHFAITRTDQTGQDGFGAIAEITFTTIAASATETIFQVQDAKLINEQEIGIATLDRASNVVVEVVTSVNLVPELAQKIKLYPMPVQSKLYIDANGLKIQRYELFDTNGKQIQNAIFERPIIDFEQLSAGIYWLRLVTDKGVLSKKVIK